MSDSKQPGRLVTSADDDMRRAQEACLRAMGPDAQVVDSACDLVTSGAKPAMVTDTTLDVLEELLGDYPVRSEYGSELHKRASAALNALAQSRQPSAQGGERTDVMHKIAEHVEVLLASAIQHTDGEAVTGYTIKTGALHQIIGLLTGNGYPVSVPLPPPAGSVSGWTAEETEAVTTWLDNVRPAGGGKEALSDAERRYRLLEIGEIICETDEFIDDDGVTWNAICGWEVGMRFNHNLKSGRRRIDAAIRAGKKG